MLKQSQRAVGNKLLEPKKIKEMLDLDQNTKKILIIDVRDAAEFEAASKDQHSRMPPLAGSVNMSLGTLFFKADQDMPDFVVRSGLGEFGFWFIVVQEEVLCHWRCW